MKKKPAYTYCGRCFFPYHFLRSCSNVKPQGMKPKKNQRICFIIGAPVLLLLMALPGRLIAQLTPPPLHPELGVLAKPQSTPNWIYFREGTSINPATIFTDLKEAFQLSAADTMLLVKNERDNLGFQQYRYQQYYKNHRIVYGEYVVHQQPNGFVKSANGRLITGLNLEAKPVLGEQSALNSALQFMNAKKYLWQNSAMERELKRQKGNETATYYPKGELVYAPAKRGGPFQAQDYRLAWHFKIYTDDPAVVAKSVYVDALTGTVIHYAPIAMNCSVGSGNSAFNSNVTIHTSATGGSYRSHNDCQATDILVYNCNGGGAANIFYTDADNTWTAASQQSAVQAQWGAEMTYDYFNALHGRASWDGAASDMIVYNNAYLGENNACWGCTGNSMIFYAGYTSAATDDWNTNDIMGHEFAHGVTQASANLVYESEPGALNESFSDIFGEMVESWSEGFTDYLIGGDRGAIRSLSNPNLYGQPDTYLGTYWVNTAGCLPSWWNDNCGVHTNSGVQNYWFYLLSEGGSGTNDLGQAYNVVGITRFKARLIAYRALTAYLTPYSQYIDARRATLEAAWDLYGQCSPEIIAVGDAWHAVGVESQSPQYAFNVCGNYPASGTFVQAISQLTAANGCAVEITPSATTVYFTARDQVILYPGFTATEGSNFVAYLEPCSSTRWISSGSASPVTRSDAEKGLLPLSNTVAPAKAAETEPAATSVFVTPNPFHTSFDIAIHAVQQGSARITVYNAVGVKVKEKRAVALSKGYNKISFDGADLATGSYLVEIDIHGRRTVQKIIKL